MFDILIENAFVSGIKTCSVGIADGKIQEVGEIKSRAASQIIDAEGKLVMPGVIDTQVHFREPGSEHKEDLATGSLSAIAGGTTSVFEMPNTRPTTTSEEALADKLSRAKGRMHCNFGFFVGAAKENAKNLAQLEMLPGTPGVKIFMGSSTGDLLIESDDVLDEVLANGRHRCSVHAEDEPRLRYRKQKFFEPELGHRQHHFLRDAEAALIASKRLAAAAKKYSRPVHVLHISTADELSLLSEIRDQGQDVTMEVTPQHLLFSCSQEEDSGSLTQMNPPIRDENHRYRLQRGLEEGKFDVFGSDHAPHLLSEKALPYTAGHDGSPSGMPGVQTMLAACLSMTHRNWITIPKMIEMLCERPAALFGIASKGKLEPGCDADVVIVDHTRLEKFDQKIIKSRCGWSPYDGMEIGLLPAFVILGGAIASVSGEPVGKPRGQQVQFDWKENR